MMTVRDPCICPRVPSMSLGETQSGEAGEAERQKGRRRVRSFVRCYVCVFDATCACT